MTRLSGTYAAIPAANLAKGARYLATEQGKVYVSHGVSWTLSEELDPSDYVNETDGTLAARPAPETCIGTIYTDENGKRYEAFPGGWFQLPAGLDDSMGAIVHGATASTARPTGFKVVTWIGSVSPTNAVNNDIWEEVA